MIEVFLKKAGLVVVMAACLLGMSCGRKQDCACTELIREKEDTEMNLSGGTTKPQAGYVPDFRDWFSRTNADSALSLLMKAGQMTSAFPPADVLAARLSQEITPSSGIVIVKYCGEEGSESAVNFLDAWIKASDQNDLASRRSGYEQGLQTIQTELENIRSSFENSDSLQQNFKRSTGMLSQDDLTKAALGAANDNVYSGKEFNLLMEKRIQLSVSRASVFSVIRVITAPHPCE